jgi:hypothetical protein
MNRTTAAAPPILEPITETLAELHCPRCDGVYLHHCDVIVYDRGEDDAICRQTSVLPGETIGSSKTPNRGSGNPSSRRHGLRILFWCELCGPGDETTPDLALCIAQHKGNTHVHWEFSI